MAAHRALIKRVVNEVAAICSGANGSLISLRRLRAPSLSPHVSELPLSKSQEGHGRRWSIKASACLQRFPAVSSEKGEVERHYEAFLEQLRFEKSRLSDYELEELQEKEKLEARRKQALEEDLSDAQMQRMDEGETFEELEEWREKALQEFRTAPRVTRADLEGDLSSLDRQLDRILYLVVREGGEWRMPCADWREGESLLETATRSVQEVFPSLEVDPLSNAPSAHRSEEGREDAIQSEIFFFKVQLKLQTTEGLLLKRGDKVCETLWLTKEELSQHLQSDYFKDIAQSLLD